jgi:hypothetical protein
MQGSREDCTMVVSYIDSEFPGKVRDFMDTTIALRSGIPETHPGVAREETVILRNWKVVSGNFQLCHKLPQPIGQLCGVPCWHRYLSKLLIN